MSFSRGTEITVTTRVPAVDDDGHPILDTYNRPTFTETTVTVVGAFAPVSGAEGLDNQDQVVTAPQAFLPTGTAIDSDSSLTIDGLSYEVVGEPEVWGNPYSGSAPGICVMLRRVTG
jgi:hypothetical protein